MKYLVILGSTGSIGVNALKVVEALPQSLRVVGLAAESNALLLLEQARRFGVRRVALADAAAARQARDLGRAQGIEVLEGAEGVVELAAQTEAETVLCALVGLAGLRPALAALEAGKDVALATKEVLVAAGELVMRRRAASGARLLPVDSEHSAIFQCLLSTGDEVACVRSAAPGAALAETSVAQLTLTASGGPFAAHPELDLERVTVEQALDHPRWRMGRKVTIDSATMMNKGLEIMEARWLFNIAAERIGVLVHPQSIVHSLVTFVDGSQMAQLSQPDMRFPIQYALTWPRRLASGMPPLDLARQGSLSFMEPDEIRFPCLRLAREAARAGGTLPAVLNAADEVAVEAFLAGEITFPGIWRAIDTVLQTHASGPADCIGAVEEADAWARRQAAQICRGTTVVQQ